MNTPSSIVHNVHNLETAKAIQTALLGVGPHTETPFYVGYNVAGFEIVLVPHGPDNTVPVSIAYIAVPDLGSSNLRSLRRWIDPCLSSNRRWRWNSHGDGQRPRRQHPPSHHPYGGILKATSIGDGKTPSQTIGATRFPPNSERR